MWPGLDHESCRTECRKTCGFSHNGRFGPCGSWYGSGCLVAHGANGLRVFAYGQGEKEPTEHAPCQDSEDYEDKQGWNCSDGPLHHENDHREERHTDVCDHNGLLIRFVRHQHTSIVPLYRQARPTVRRCQGSREKRGLANHPTSDLRFTSYPSCHFRQPTPTRNCKSGLPQHGARSGPVYPVLVADRLTAGNPFEAELEDIQRFRKNRTHNSHPTADAAPFYIMDIDRRQHRRSWAFPDLCYSHNAGR